jgi:molybdopterin molybdotransferase/putative molybdopterin biosynthesis protein
MRPELEHLIRKEQALALLFSQWAPQPGTEQLPLAQCVGRVLAEDQFAGYDLPLVRASTMDGVAVQSAAFADGMPDTTGWQLGREYVRADTGDDFPDEYDAVIAIEEVTLLENGGILLSPEGAVRPGLNVKPGGADVKAGEPLVKKGTLLTPMDLAALAMGGISHIPVVVRPVVAFLPTGSELVPPGTQLQRGQNFDSNSVLVETLLRQMGAEPLMHPIVKDDPIALGEAIDTLLPQCDILLVNAGTSKGGEDYCADLLAQRGKVLFHGVAAVPGRPMSMAVLGGKAAINLSGPAFAAFYSMDWAVRALVAHWLGQPVPQRPTVTATLTQPLKTPPFFSQMVPLGLELGEDGKYLATPLALRGPNRVGTAAALTAPAAYISTPGEPPHPAGEEITVELLRAIQ